VWAASIGLVLSLCWEALVLVTEQENKRGVEEIHSRIDDLRAANYSMSEKLDASLKRLEAGLSELSAVSSELRSFKSEQHKAGIIAGVTDSVGGLFAKHAKPEEMAVLFGKEVSKELDEKLSKLAELESELLKKSEASLAAAQEAANQFSAIREWSKEQDKRTIALADSIAEVKSGVTSSRHQLESSSSKIASAVGEMKAFEHKFGSKLSDTQSEIKISVSEAFDQKLSKLAELEAELFEKESENAEKLSSIAQNMGALELSQNKEELMINALANLSGDLKAMDGMVRQQVALRQEENYAAMRVALLKIAENQNKLSEVLADSLTALLDSSESSKNTLAEVKLHVTAIKSQIDLENPADMEKKISEKLAKRLSEA